MQQNATRSNCSLKMHYTAVPEYNLIAPLQITALKYERDKMFQTNYETNSEVAETFAPRCKRMRAISMLFLMVAACKAVAFRLQTEVTAAADVK